MDVTPFQLKPICQLPVDFQTRFINRIFEGKQQQGLPLYGALVHQFPYSEVITDDRIVIRGLVDRLCR
uniref:Uncharacterized protein n=1 Tax=Rhizophora mucronata TaxID=61149 RepID=A0A2P2MVS9_RHIMU